MIGVYDSGIGGMLLAGDLAKCYGRHRVFFYGETSGFDLNVSSTAHIVDQARTGCQFLVDQGAELIVLACHEASALAAPALRTSLPVPLLDVLTVSAQTATEVSAGGRIGLIGTRTIIASGGYQVYIATRSPTTRLFCQACPLLLPLVEEGWYTKVETKMIVKRCLRPLKDQQIDTLVPACSHYQLVLPLIAARAGRRVRLIDPFKLLIAAVVDRVALSDDGNRPPDGDRYRIQITRRTPQVERMMATCFGRRFAPGEAS